MRLPREKFINELNRFSGLEELFVQVELAINSWEYKWSPFVSAPLREEAIKIISQFEEVWWETDGGYPVAERQRIKFIRSKMKDHISNLKIAPIKGLIIEGNFLFDQPKPNEIRLMLEKIGVPPSALGDIWIHNDRSANAFCTPEVAEILNESISTIREVTVSCKAIETNQFLTPVARQPKRIFTIEASKRLDAIASAGFGISRSKISNQIKQGLLRLNWRPIKQLSRELIEGDRVQHETKGRIEILKIEPTKRDRWKIELLRT